ncbi:hypothetical protein [Bradyrhizobium cenepequi]|uniref:hypothetical protein n=1 Tax=Bradyrhizobium cenepequi TaxID=2821403 RepID=UPI001CE32259|nr:hypothetical protein [Bradyrhizobium cenepequi]MCA6110869.1 hypothetical protein [Bradyrhizobium cenepequi]
MRCSFHRFVVWLRVPDYLRLGWLALPTLDGTHHGYWAVHMVWLCDSPIVEPTWIFGQAVRDVAHDEP